MRSLLKVKPLRAERESLGLRIAVTLVRAVVVLFQLADGAIDAFCPWKASEVK